MLKRNSTAGDICCRRKLGSNFRREKKLVAFRQIHPRIDRVIILPHFVMKMGSGGAAADADSADNVTLVHPLARMNCKIGKVTIPRRQTIAVIEDDEIAVVRPSIRENHLPVSRG